jgi:adenylate cyclase class 2
MYEVEQKYRLADVAAFESKLRELGVDSFETIEQVDTYLAHPSRDFGETDEAFRVRRVGELNFVTYKGPKIDATTKTRREIELPLPDGAAYAEDFKRLQEALGFQLVAEVHKVRKKSHLRWQEADVEIVIDDVTGVGWYTELEIVADESEVESAKARLASLAEELNLQESERRSYLELLRERAS